MTRASKTTTSKAQTRSKTTKKSRAAAPNRTAGKPVAKTTKAAKTAKNAKNAKAQKRDTLPPKSDPAFESYLSLLEEIWRDVHPLIGAVTLSALFKSAARRLAPAHPCIAGLEVSIEGVDPNSLRKTLGTVPSVEAIAALRDLIRDLLTLFESIAGAVIVRMLLPKIVRAEKGAPVAQA